MSAIETDPLVITNVLRRHQVQNAVALKYLGVRNGGTHGYQLADETGVATMIVVEPSDSSFDRKTYPMAAASVLIAGERPDLTAPLLDHLPGAETLVFKIADSANHALIAKSFSLERCNGYFSYTGGTQQTGSATITQAPDDAAYALFAAQGHSRPWLERQLAIGEAFACIHAGAGEPLSACFAFEIDQGLWEIGGVITPEAHRGQGHGRRVVGTALGELARRNLLARYQVDENNRASIALAESLGMARFTHLSHYLARK